MHVRRDSAWIVSEPELTLAVDSRGRIIGYTVGNDLSCRDLEGENPLYLPQAKTCSACAAIGPGPARQRPSPARHDANLAGHQARGAARLRGSGALVNTMA